MLWPEVVDAIEELCTGGYVAGVLTGATVQFGFIFYFFVYQSGLALVLLFSF